MEPTTRRFVSREQYLTTRGEPTVPLPAVGFDQQSPVDLFTKNLGEDAARMGTAWKRTVRQQFKVSEGYEHVAALIVRWNDGHDTDLKCAKEVDELHDLFRNEHHYDSTVLKLDTQTRPQQQLNHAIGTLVRHHDGDHRSHLIIVYYSGHGIGRESGELELTAVPNNDNPRIGSSYDPRVSWTRAERDLDDAEADVLIVLDCCAAGNIIKKGILGNDTVHMEARAALVADSRRNSPGRSGGFSIATQFVDVVKEGLQSGDSTNSSGAAFKSQAKAHEVWVACGGRQKAEAPGEKSFTRHFIDILREELQQDDGPPICTFDLNSRITRQRPDVTSSSQVFQRYAHMRHDRFIQFVPLQRPVADGDESGSMVKRNRETAYFHLSVSLGSKTSLNDAEVERLATDLSSAAKRAHPDITSIEWGGFQLTPDVIRFQRTLWRLTITVYYIRRWKRMVRKNQKRKATSILDDGASNPPKRQATATSGLYLSADPATMPISPSPSMPSVSGSETPRQIVDTPKSDV